MNNLKLCESEYRFMQIVWKNQPVPSSVLVKLCLAELGWKKSTTYTVLRKLCERGFAKNESSVITALVEEARVRRFESELIIDKAFGGSLPAFVASFINGKTLSEAEAEELKRLIDKHREDAK